MFCGRFWHCAVASFGDLQVDSRAPRSQDFNMVDTGDGHYSDSGYPAAVVTTSHGRSVTETNPYLRSKPLRRVITQKITAVVKLLSTANDLMESVEENQLNLDRSPDERMRIIDTSSAHALVLIHPLERYVQILADKIEEWGSRIAAITDPTVMHEEAIYRAEYITACLDPYCRSRRMFEDEETLTLYQQFRNDCAAAISDLQTIINASTTLNVPAYAVPSPLIDAHPSSRSIGPSSLPTAQDTVPRPSSTPISTATERASHTEPTFCHLNMPVDKVVPLSPSRTIHSSTGDSLVHLPPHFEQEPPNVIPSGSIPAREDATCKIERDTSMREELLLPTLSISSSSLIAPSSTAHSENTLHLPRCERRLSTTQPSISPSTTTVRRKTYEESMMEKAERERELRTMRQLKCNEKQRDCDLHQEKSISGSGKIDVIQENKKIDQLLAHKSSVNTLFPSVPFTQLTDTVSSQSSSIVPASHPSMSRPLISPHSIHKLRKIEEPSAVSPVQMSQAMMERASVEGKKILPSVTSHSSACTTHSRTLNDHGQTEKGKTSVMRSSEQKEEKGERETLMNYEEKEPIDQRSDHLDQRSMCSHKESIYSSLEEQEEDGMIMPNPFSLSKEELDMSEMRTIEIFPATSFQTHVSERTKERLFSTLPSSPPVEHRHSLSPEQKEIDVSSSPLSVKRSSEEMKKMIVENEIALTESEESRAIESLELIDDDEHTHDCPFLTSITTTEKTEEQRSSLTDQSTPSTKHNGNEMSSIHLCVKEQEGDTITEDISTYREKKKKIVNEGSTDDDRSLEMFSDHSVHKYSFQSHSISMNRSLIANVGNGKKQGEDEDLGGREQTERLDHMFSTEILDASTVTLEGNTPFPKWTSNVLKMERLEEARKESATAQQDLLSQEAFTSPLLTVTTVIAENPCTISMIVEVNKRVCESQSMRSYDHSLVSSSFDQIEHRLRLLPIQEEEKDPSELNGYGDSDHDVPIDASCSTPSPPTTPHDGIRPDELVNSSADRDSSENLRTLLRPFRFTTVELVGPLYCRDRLIGMEAYALLFTCVETHSIHFEMMWSTEVKEFFSAFTRFTKQRGYSEELWSNTPQPSRHRNIPLSDPLTIAHKKLHSRLELQWRMNWKHDSLEQSLCQELQRTFTDQVKVMVTSLLNGFMTLEKMTNVFIQTEDIVNRMSTETILVRPLLSDDSRKEEVNACLDNHSDFDIEKYYNEFMRERDEVCDEINSLQCLLPDSIHTMHDMDKVNPVEDLSPRQVLQLSEWNHADERSLEESVMKKAVPNYDKDKRAEKVINALDSNLKSNEIREVIYRVMGFPEPCRIRVQPWKPQMIFSRRGFLELTKEFPDPAGLFSPLTVKLKKLAQRLNIGKEMPNWLTNDEKEEVNDFIGRFRTCFFHVPMMPFPIFPEREKNDGEVVVFCHGDQSSYAAAVYWMSSVDNATTLILAKVRLLPSPDPLTRRAYARPEADLLAVELGLSLLHEAQKVLSNHDPEVKIGAATCLTDYRTTFHRLSERHSDKMEMMNWFARQKMAKITEMEGSILRDHSNRTANDNGLKTLKKALRKCDVCKQQHIPVPFDLPSISTMAIVSCLLTVVTPCENASIKSKRTPADLPTELYQSSPPPPITTLLPQMTMQGSNAAMKPMKPPRSLSSWLLPFKPSWNTLSDSFALLFSRVSAVPPRARAERDKRMMIVQGSLIHSSHSDMDIHDLQVADGKKEEPNVRHQQLRLEQEQAKIRERQKLMCIRSPKPEASSSLSKVPDRTTLTAPISQSGDMPSVDDHAASAAESLTEKNSSSQQKHGAIGAMNSLKIEVTGTGRRVMSIDPRMLKKQDAGNIASISKNCTESGRAPQKRKIARCEFCNRTNHSADQCRKVVDEMDRRAVLTKYRRCFSCLSKNCNGICGDRCERCTLKGHHSTICMEEVE
ncbi:hypothetical protein PRIPAC_77801 [Pristionchus pacificus]|uniref:Uncharacterized protein n=2 Tax=Pristionchus pacificus TaxID=54126 RepID=A0A2A6CL61_PRIPA|nr:hypothetical protein PRIPAC_77801 [Pristionchus pacificus]|eukprot:PDM78856.1 hypothetical protein PRIPAC_31435 [Pristionchus pacificus]